MKNKIYFIATLWLAIAHGYGEKLSMDKTYGVKKMHYAPIPDRHIENCRLTPTVPLLWGMPSYGYGTLPLETTQQILFIENRGALKQIIPAFLYKERFASMDAFVRGYWDDCFAKWLVWKTYYRVDMGKPLNVMQFDNDKDVRRMVNTIKTFMWWTPLFWLFILFETLLQLQVRKWRKAEHSKKKSVYFFDDFYHE